MKIKTKYNRIERIIYEFDMGDIRRALMNEVKLHFETGKDILFEIDEDGGGNPIAILTVECETPLANETGDDA